MGTGTENGGPGDGVYASVANAVECGRCMIYANHRLRLRTMGDFVGEIAAAVAENDDELFDDNVVAA